MIRKSAYLVSLASVCVASLVFADDVTPGVPSGPQTAVRYATDAYPGFDNEKEIVSPERKTPRWLSFIFGPNRDDARSQLAYCVDLIRDGDYSKARRQLDALVREWPTSPEAPKAQQALAEICLSRLSRTEDAFAEYRYLLDFYSLQTDYDKIANKLYEIAEQMRREGREVMFIHFENVVDVRRAYEACVLHAPGAAWVPKALLTVGALRVKEGKMEEAVRVYENLRNIYPDAPEATESLIHEARARQTLIGDHEYNSSRAKDTLGFLKQAETHCRAEDLAEISGIAADIRRLLEDEAYRSTVFYDSPTRTRRSAINAYEKFLSQYPDSAYAEKIRLRLTQLKEDGK